MNPYKHLISNSSNFPNMKIDNHNIHQILFHYHHHNLHLLKQSYLHIYLHIDYLLNNRILYIKNIPQIYNQYNKHYNYIHQVNKLLNYYYHNFLNTLLKRDYVLMSIYNKYSQYKLRIKININ